MILFLIDLFTPVLLGLVYIVLIDSDTAFNTALALFFLYGLIVVIISYIRNFYNNYFSINFSEKLKISFITSISAIFFQLVIISYFSISINIFLFLTWMLIPIVILSIRYFIKIKYTNETKIYIIGTLYKFNSHEIVTLTKKGFIVFFFDTITDMLASKKYKDNSMVVININQNINLITSDINNLRQNNKCISLATFMEDYLRKVYITENKLIIDLDSYDRLSYLLKRIIDFSVSFILIPILIIVIIYMFLQKLRGGLNESILYSQNRYGINKKIFPLIKIRTMYENSDKKGNTTKNDNRVYPFARVLRKYRLDELPQIMNIFLGKMHLVGPRAEWVKLSDNYYKNIKNYSFRHIVRPGITGWAQIMYPYGEDENDSRQKLMYELYYIKNWTIWLELEICLKTMFVVLDKRGF
tara:strand:+ start:76 stop:1314 length:1239 start_codon:yes stop_codon:yes gene_type:complete